MIRRLALLVGSLTFAVTCWPAPWATADPSSSQYVRTESGKVRCWVTANNQGHGGGPAVVCEASGPDTVGFLQAPMNDYGSHWHNAVVDGSGNFHWQDANIGGAHLENDLVLNYGQTYHISGWTILPSSDSTRFTNDATGHGMFVSIENVNSF